LRAQLDATPDENLNPDGLCHQNRPGSPPAPSSSLDNTGYEYAVLEDEAQSVVAGSRKPFEDCEEEQIHIPGAVQSFGVLVALASTPDRKLVVRMVSENSPAILHYSVRDLFRLDNFLDALPDLLRPEFESRLWKAREPVTETSVDSGPAVFSMAIKNPEGTVIPVCCAMHFEPNSRGLVICEFEEEYRIDTSPSLPNHPVNTLHKTQPVTADQPHRDAPTSETSDVDAHFSPLVRLRMKGLGLVSVIAHVQSRLSSAKTVEELSDRLVDSVQQIAKFHRVMVYRFDSAFNGAVIAETIDPRASGDSYKNLRFPASDIPGMHHAETLLSSIISTDLFFQFRPGSYTRSTKFDTSLTGRRPRRELFAGPLTI
jgi:light-regulated signal transduction histidine kinase (bacteriophytochrome)